jgi:hypothetical protein
MELFVSCLVALMIGITILAVISIIGYVRGLY